MSRRSVNPQNAKRKGECLLIRMLSVGATIGHPTNKIGRDIVSLPILWYNGLTEKPPPEGALGTCNFKFTFRNAELVACFPVLFYNNDNGTPETIKEKEL